MAVSIAGQRPLIPLPCPLLASDHPPPWLSSLLASNHLFHCCVRCWPATTNHHDCLHCWPATTHHHGCLHVGQQRLIPLLCSLLASDNQPHGCLHCWPATINSMAVSLAGQQPPTTMTVSIVGKQPLIPLPYPLLVSDHPPPWLSPSHHHDCFTCKPATIQ